MHKILDIDLESRFMCSRLSGTLFLKTKKSPFYENINNLPQSGTSLCKTKVSKARKFR